MNSLDNYIIGPSSENTAFLELSEMVLNLDRPDFVAGYVVDESMHPKIGVKEPSSSGKRKATESPVKTPVANTSRPILITVSDDEEDAEPIGSQLLLTPQTAYRSSSLVPVSEDQHGSSDTSLPSSSPPPRREKKKQKEDPGVDLASAMFERMQNQMMEMEERQNKRMMDMFERERAERERLDRERNERERIERENSKRMDNEVWLNTFNLMMEKIPGVVKNLVEAALPKPLQMLDPAYSQGGQLLLANRPTNSYSSGAADHPSHSAPAVPVAQASPPVQAPFEGAQDRAEGRSENVASPDPAVDSADVEMVVAESEDKAADVQPGSSP